VVLPEAGRLDRFDAVARLSSDPLLRLSALLPDDPDRVAGAAQRLRLSNAQRDRLLAALAAEPPVTPEMSERAARAAIYRLGAAGFADRLLRACAESHGSAERIAPLLHLAASWSPPRFPLGGREAMDAGARGPAVGRLLRAVEDWWVAHDFPHTGAAEQLAELAGSRADD
jgi:poly(A) polymerase